MHGKREGALAVMLDMPAAVSITEIDPMHPTMHVPGQDHLILPEHGHGEHLALHPGDQTARIGVGQIPAHDPPLASGAEECTCLRTIAQGVDGPFMAGEAMQQANG